MTDENRVFRTYEAWKAYYYTADFIKPLDFTVDLTVECTINDRYDER
jgi:hypothetical protein